MVIFIIVVVAAVLFLVGYGLKLFRFERVERKAAVAEEPEPQEEPEEELVNLVEYFGAGDKQEEPEEKEPPRETDTEPPAFDKLTGLMTGRFYFETCDKALEAAFEEDSNYVVVSFDIDRFRFINSVKGYSLGDYVLSHMAQDVLEVFPQGAALSRISADHFLVSFAVPETPPYEEYVEGLKRVCERIRVDIAVKSAVRLCMGIAEADPTQGKEAYRMDLLARKANLARQCLKGARSENYALYNDSIVTSLLYGESALEDYSENQYGDEISLYFQPIMDLARGKLGGGDALVRWVCQEVGNEPLLPEESHIPTNNIKVFYQTCKALSRWRKTGKSLLPIFLEIPETEFYKTDLDEFFIKCLGEFQLEAGLLYAVIDASLILLDKNIAASQMKKLRDAGITVGVGGIDFAYNDLSILKELPISFIKLKRSVAHNLHRDSEKAARIKPLLSAAEAMKLRVVLEGIDSTEHMKAVQKQLGTMLIEGRYAGKAVQGDDFLRLMDESSTMNRAGNTTVILSESEFKSGNFML